jgi:hypothetical protein
MLASKLFSRFVSVVTVLILAFTAITPVLAVGSNDNFSSATSIGALPFSSSVDMNGATYEAGEPMPTCGYGYQPNSTWFSYTPSANATITARAFDYATLAVYTGSGIGDLTQAFCGNYYPNITLQAQANVTYYFQLSYTYPWYSGNIPFSLEVTPPPSVSVNYYPYDPSTFDNMSFNAWIYDPAGIYGNTYAWSISDGTTSNLSSFNHQFAADGDYAVSLTFTTYDGRSATANSTVQVRTRDVAITKLSVPQTAKVNTTKTINVEVSNKNYSDNVQVVLYKGLPGGGEQMIGVLTIYVPARANRPTVFKFSYTFTSADATLGKVTFRAVATLVNGRDSLPADNTAIGTTLVTGGVSYP